ncbi:sensor [Kordiimonas sediminis]|uniref:Sensor n=1 Tax=Kordiimonas sediminis TaxID=1735581 RepID=A0A919ARD1_9PROT|nr:FecR domain-containing protein [Kordiimonas sediminis]GHF22316.1 sensor [Kordiimonas sediminis]
MTNDNIIPLPMTDRIEEQAAIWVMRLAEGEILDTDAELHEWLGESPQHRDAFERLNGFWDGLDFVTGLNDFAESDVAKASIRQARMAHRFGFLRPVLTGAVAASVVLAFISFGVQLFDQWQSPYQGNYHTAIGEQQTVSLPDGSTVILNTDSVIDVDFTDTARRITLVRGEAYFDVAPDKKKPFSVETSKGSVTAVGTAFSVKLVTEKLNVVVTEGRVALQAQTPEPTLVAETVPAGEPSQEKRRASSMEVTAGQTATIDQGIEEVSIIQPDALEKALDWQDGELSFRGETLEQVIEEIGRYTDIRIEIADEELRNQKIVAYYKMGDVERIFEAFNVMANIGVERISPHHVRLYRAG